MIDVVVRWVFSCERRPSCDTPAVEVIRNEGLHADLHRAVLTCRQLGWTVKVDEETAGDATHRTQLAGTRAWCPAHRPR